MSTLCLFQISFNVINVKPKTKFSFPLRYIVYDSQSGRGDVKNQLTHSTNSLSVEKKTSKIEMVFFNPPYLSLQEVRLENIRIEICGERCKLDTLIEMPFDCQQITMQNAFIQQQSRLLPAQQQELQQKELH